MGRISSSRLQAETRYKKRKHIASDDLAPQVKKLEAKNGATVYLIGTAHLSNASNYQVGKIIDQARLSTEHFFVQKSDFESDFYEILLFS